MARKPTKKPEPRLLDQLKDQHWLTKVALACVVLFVIVVAITNAFGWPRLIAGPLGYAAAAVAIVAAGLAFSMWEHVRRFAAEERWPNAAGALLLFIGALVWDGIGVHSGIMVFADPWVAQMEEQADIEQAEAQRDLDARRSQMQREINDIQARIDAVPLDLSGGPQNDAIALQAWNGVTAADRARVETKQTALDAMARNAPRPEVAPWLERAVTGFSIFVEIVVGFGVTILGIEIAPRFVAAKPEAPKPAPPIQPTPQKTPAPVIQITTARPSRRARGGDASRWSGWN